MVSRVVLHCQDITKVIKHKTILDRINLRVPQGAVYGITGANGSGKTMLLRTIIGLVRPTSGTVTVFDTALGQQVEFAPNTGALIGTPGFLPNYTGKANLKLLNTIRRSATDDDIVQAIKSVGLDPEDNRPFNSYSTGMRQRLGIAQAIFEQPSLVILDEPTRGLDAGGQSEILTLIKKLQQDGKTVLFTTHYAQELQELCDEVFMMVDGRLTETTRTAKLTPYL